MTEDEFRRHLESHLRDNVNDAQYVGENPVVKETAAGSWIVSRRDAQNQGLSFTQNGVFRFLGALGKHVKLLGAPLSNERLLGSSREGRYQFFEGGIAVWERVDDGDLGYPTQRWSDFNKRNTTHDALVAFFDIRGFTQWTSAHDRQPREVQGIVEKIESSFQASFDQMKMPDVFAKGTGDGLMIVSVAKATGPASVDAAITPQHAVDFCCACASTLERCCERIMRDEELAVGCGIARGRVSRVNILGRSDYIGAAINEASKLQGLAFNELCLTEAVMGLIRSATILAPDGRVLPGKGVRLQLEEVARLKTAR